MKIIPVFRMFDEHKAREFYGEWLGFTIDWEHRFEPDTPLYMQVSKDELVLHLSEHYGDANPGSNVLVMVDDLDARLAELQSRPYKYYRPGIQEQEWGLREMKLLDPFGNKIVFAETIAP